MKGLQTYVCLLRGINVSGQKLIKMDALRKMFESLKFQDVTTYVQSGNVLFRTAQSSTDSLGVKIRARIERDFRFDVAVTVLTAVELKRAMKLNPFSSKKEIVEKGLYVTFLSKKPLASDVVSLKKYSTSGEGFEGIGKALYLYCPRGYGRTKLSNNLVEKKLSVSATTRNWRTVQALCLLSEQIEEKIGL